MLKKISQLSDKEKKTINWGVFIMFIVAIMVLSIDAYEIYKEDGFKACLEIEDTYTGDKEKKCFNSTKERKDWLEEWAKNISEPNFMDNNYISEYINLSVIVD